MNELTPVYCTTVLIVGLVLANVFVFKRWFDPFAPIWLFITGYFQVYVVQAFSYREWAVSIHGEELVTEANWRAFWGILLFILVYYFGPGRWFSGKMPRSPIHWSMPVLSVVVPVMLTWGFFCSIAMIIQGGDSVSKGGQLLRQFYFMMLAAGVILMITGSQRQKPAPMIFWSGVGVTSAFIVLWIFQGKRSPSLIGLLALAAAYYGPRFKKPPVAVLLLLAVVGSCVVAVSLGWRNQRLYERNVTGFVQFLSDFDVSSTLVSLNLAEKEGHGSYKKEFMSKETEEYGGFLLMYSTVPDRSGYDYGASYLRLFTTFIPRIVWADKPIPGRDKWIAAWIAGSEFKRDESFTGPAIGIMGATQLNGGAVGTVIVMTILGVVLSTSYQYYRRYQWTPWAQVWWPLTYYNAWLMTVNDDPLVWFYYIYGFSIMPAMIFLWVINRISETQYESRMARWMIQLHGKKTAPASGQPV